MDDGEFQSSSSLSISSIGSYEITVIDNNECQTSDAKTVIADTSLADEIMPIISNNCATSSSCHGSGASGSRPDFSVSSNVISRASSIRSRTQSGNMPPSGSGISLTQDEIDLIACWVDSGASDN